MLLAFPYYSNYIDLVRMELNALASVKANLAPRTFAMIGSGPLPLTPLCIAAQLKSQGYGCITCHNVDLNPQAMEYSINMCKALGHAAGTMCFHCADASSDDVDLRTFDVVYLAALVGGCSSQKQSILANIIRRMSPGTLVVMRSAHSLRRLLYPVRISPPVETSCSLTLQQVVEVTEDMAKIGLKVLQVVHPYSHVINSVVIAIVVEVPCIPVHNVARTGFD